MWLRRTAAIVRIILGGAFLFLGAIKLMDPEFLYGGLLHHIVENGVPFPFYQRFLQRFVELHQELFAYTVAVGEILVGLSLLSGIWVSGGVLGGIFLVANFALATTWGNLPMLLAHLGLLALLVVLGCCGAGLTWGCDGWLVTRMNEKIVLFPWRRSVPASPVRLVPQATTGGRNRPGPSQPPSRRG
jgi:uncharacterized membrane protein YphA (DoxX/SURF4 family)